MGRKHTLIVGVVKNSLLLFRCRDTPPPKSNEKKLRTIGSFSEKAGGSWVSLKNDVESRGIKRTSGVTGRGSSALVIGTRVVVPCWAVGCEARFPFPLSNTMRSFPIFWTKAMRSFPFFSWMTGDAGMYGEICRGFVLGDKSSTSLFVISAQFEAVSFDNFAKESRLLAETMTSSLSEHAFGLNGKGVRRLPSSLMGIPGGVTRSGSWSSLGKHGRSSS